MLEPLKGKLCSNPLIDNVDLYLAFYHAGLRPCDVAKLFGKKYHIVWGDIKKHTDLAWAERERKWRQISKERHGHRNPTKEHRAKLRQRRKIIKYMKEQMRGTYVLSDEQEAQAEAANGFYRLQKCVDASRRT